MRIRKRVCAVTILSAILLAAILAMLAFRTRQENQSGVPDIVNSTRLNDCEHLTVVANRRDIADKEAFSHELIGMCRENTFHSVKLSFPLSALEISVYLQRGPEQSGDRNPHQVCKGYKTNESEFLYYIA